MTTEESNPAVKNLEAVYNNVREASPNLYVSITVQHAADLLDYIAELETKVPAEPVRAYKLGDKVQEVTDDEDKPWGYVTEMRESGQYVRLENTRHVGRKLLYFDDEIEPFVEAPAFTIGQKVRERTSGSVGTVLFENNGKYEVMFQKNFGSMSLPFYAEQLEAV